MLDHGVAELWSQCLGGAYDERPADRGPDPVRWFAAFRALIDADDESHHFTFMRGALDNRGISFPLLAEVDPKFTRGLWTPAGRLDYDEVFERVIRETGRLWIDIARAIAMDEVSLLARPDLNLDTGKVIPVGFALWGASQ